MLDASDSEFVELLGPAEATAQPPGAGPRPLHVGVALVLQPHDGPGGAERGALEVQQPRLEGEQHGAGEGQLLAPVRHRVRGEDEGVLYLLHQLVRDLL